METLFDTTTPRPTEAAVTAPSFHCRVHGEPQPQGSMKAFTPRGGRFAVVTASNAAKLKPWRNTMTVAFIEVAESMSMQRPTYTEPVEVCVEVILPRLKSMPKTGKGAYRWPTAKGDLDKHQRAVGDALAAAQIVADDSLICAWRAIKRYAEIGESAGIIVDIWPMASRSLRMI